MTRNINEPTIERAAAQGKWGVTDLRNRPGYVSEGQAVFHIKVTPDQDEPVEAGDAAFVFEIPEDLDGVALMQVEGYVTTVSDGGDIELQVRNVTGAVDMLSTPITIEDGELNSKDAAGLQPVVADANAVVAWGDHIAIDVDQAGANALGLGVILWFLSDADSFFFVKGSTGTTGAQGPEGPQGPQGDQGPAGGITAFEGEWQDATAYSEGDAVSHNGSSYAAREDHTSDAANDEPGVGTNWEDEWMLLASGVEGGGGGVDPVAVTLGTPDTAFEFDASSLTGLTAMGSPTTEDADTTIPDHYYIAQAAAGSVSWKGRYVAASTPFTAVAKLSAFAGYQNFNAAGLIIAEASPGKLTVFGKREQGTHDLRLQLTGWTSPTGSGSNLGSALQHAAWLPVYMAVVATSSTDVGWYFSFDGYVWTRFVAAMNPAYTVGAVGIAINCENGTYAVAAAFDYLRIWNSALTLLGSL